MDPKASDDENGPVEYESDEDAVGRQSVMSIERQSRLQQQQNHENKHSHHQDKQTEDVQTKKEAQTQLKQPENEPVTVISVEYSAPQPIETTHVQQQHQHDNPIQPNEIKHQEVHQQSSNLQTKQETQNEQVESNNLNTFNHTQKEHQNHQQIPAPPHNQPEPTATEVISQQKALEDKKQNQDSHPETTHQQQVHHEPIKPQVQESTEVVAVVQDSQIPSNQQSHPPPQASTHAQTQQVHHQVQETHSSPPTVTQHIKEKIEQPQQTKFVSSPQNSKQIELQKIRPNVVYAQLQQKQPQPQQLHSEQRVLIPLVNQANDKIVAESPKQSKREKGMVQTERVLIESIRQKPLKQQKATGGPKGCNACQIM